MHQKIIYSLFFFLLCFGTLLSTNAQDPTVKKETKKHKYTLYVGAGPNYYFNNLVLAKDYVNEFNYAIVTRFMWEPEHFISMGFETGYNRLYTVSGDPSVTKGTKIINAAIPIQLVVSMKFLQHFYGSFSLGQSIRLNKISSSNANDYNATNFSLGDLGMGLGYKKIVGPRFTLGAELKGYYSSKLNDVNMGLVFIGGYRF